MLDACYWPPPAARAVLLMQVPQSRCYGIMMNQTLCKCTKLAVKREATFCGSKNINWLCEMGQPTIVSDVPHDYRQLQFPSRLASVMYLSNAQREVP